MPSIVNESNKLTSTNNPFTELDESTLSRLINGLAGAEILLENIASELEANPGSPMIEVTAEPGDVRTSLEAVNQLRMCLTHPGSILQKHGFAINELKKLKDQQNRAPSPAAKPDPVKLPEQFTIFDMAVITAMNRGKDQSNLQDVAASHLAEALDQQAAQSRMISSLLSEHLNAPKVNKMVSNEELLSQAAQSLSALSNTLSYCADLIWDCLGGSALVKWS